MQKLISICAVLLVGFVLANCANINSEDRRVNAQILAFSQAWKMMLLSGNQFTLASYVPELPAKNDTLTIYIEGDGFAWRTRSQPSDNPTPLNPIALKMALQHNNSAAAYLARPCQYVKYDYAKGCAVNYWTDRRFAPEVIAATDLAINQLKKHFEAKHLVLVGYSGGGAVAALVAAKRQDVALLVTVAGNLDHVAWTKLHHVPLLKGSLNAADEWESLQNVSQLHYVGGKDRNISLQVINSYLARFPYDHRPAVRVIEGFDHGCCWAEQWPDLLKNIPK